jgi:large subunit ribosomal protein L30
MIAAVKVRGSIDADEKVTATFNSLNLDSTNQVILLKDEASSKGMLNKVKDYVTYGEVSEETVEALEERAGRDLEAGDTVNLSPPSGGYRSTKKNVNQGGSLGERQNLDELIQKMV